MNDDLERTLRDSLDRHATGARRSDGSLDDVYTRAHRRRARRRSVAIVGSIAVVAIGIVGFATLDHSQDPTLQQAAAPGLELPTTTTWADTNVYACTGYLGSKNVDLYGQREIYGDCVPVTWEGGDVAATPVTGTGVAMGCIVPTTSIPATTIPMTTIPTTLADGGPVNATAEAVPCLDPTTAYPAGCIVPTTVPMTTMSTTTSSTAAPGEPVPNATAVAAVCGSAAPIDYSTCATLPVDQSVECARAGSGAAGPASSCFPPITPLPTTTTTIAAAVVGTLPGDAGTGSAVACGTYVDEPVPTTSILTG
jgi:hypothetical protein